MTKAGQPMLVTSDEFVTDLLSEMATRGITELKLSETLDDRQFEEAFDDLIQNREELGIVVDFSLARNPYHGDSSTLRESLYALREQGLVTINNPRFKTIEIKLSREDAEFYLGHSSLSRPFVSRLVDAYFDHATDGATEEPKQQAA